MNPNDPAELNPFWQSHIEAWQSSGLSQAAYCKESDLIIHRFGYWKRKLLDTPLVTPKPVGLVSPSALFKLLVWILFRAFLLTDV